MKNPKPIFRGIIPPLVTPLRADGELDEAGLERLVAHVLSGGVQGLFILGTTGEGPGLSFPQRREVVRRVCAQVGGEVPVLVGITHSSFDGALSMAECAAEAGAAAAVVAAPPYYPTHGEELLDYLEAMSPRSALPLILYHVPGANQVRIDWKTAAAAARIEGVVGYKDSSGDMIHFHKVRLATRELEGFSLTVGPEELLAEALLMGADGGVSGGANLFPRLYTGLFEACRRLDHPKILELHQTIIHLSQTLYELDTSSVGYIKAIKAALHRMDLCEPHMTMPFQALDTAHDGVIDETLNRLKFLESPSPGSH